LDASEDEAALRYLEGWGLPPEANVYEAIRAKARPAAIDICMTAAACYDPDLRAGMACLGIAFGSLLGVCNGRSAPLNST
jgi:hypothetical protein